MRKKETIFQHVLALASVPAGRVVVMVVLAMTFVACGIDKNMKRGEKHLAIGEYYDAANEFKQAYRKTPPKERDERGRRALKMAFCYDRINQTTAALAAYRNAIRYKQASIDDRLSFARLLLKNGEYKTAVEEFKAVLDSMPDNILAKNGLKSAQQAPEWKKEGSRYTVKKMDFFNSRRAEYSPMLQGDESDKLYFTSTRNDAQGDELSGITGTKAADIFFSEKDDKGKWSRPEPVSGGLNTDFDEGACSFSPDGREMYLTQCVTDPSYPRYAQIVKSNRSDAAWGKATEVKSLTTRFPVMPIPPSRPMGNGSISVPTCLAEREVLTSGEYDCWEEHLVALRIWAIPLTRLATRCSPPSGLMAISISRAMAT